MEMAGIDPQETVPGHVLLDSVSFVPYLSNPAHESIRSFTYSDSFSGNFDGVEGANFAIRNAEFKLLRNNGPIEFYNLLDDPYEQRNLLDEKLNEHERSQYEALDALVTELRAGDPAHAQARN